MTRIRGFRPPTETLPDQALAARLLMDNARLRKALLQVIRAAQTGATLVAIEQMARDGLRGALA